MSLANFNGKEHLRHRAVSLRQHGFLVVTNDSWALCDNKVQLLFITADRTNGRNGRALAKILRAYRLSSFMTDVTRCG